MSAKIIPVIVGEGYVAHKFWATAANAAKIEKSQFLYAGSHCGEYGRLLPPNDAARLCQTCFRGDKRTVGEWKAANDREKAKATADSLFGIFGMKEV